MKDIITVAVVNFHVSSANKISNLNRICGYIEAAGKQGADLILFPEMCLTGYDWFIDENISQEAKIEAAETIHGSSCEIITEVAKEQEMYAVFGMPEKEEGGDRLYNSAVAVGPSGIIGAYRKVHPFDTENTWCVKGNEPFMFDTPWGPVSIGICYDTYQFPELMRYYVHKGCRLYLNPTAVVEEVDKSESRRAFKDYYVPTLEYGVLCNTIYVVSANLTGWDQGSFFGGGSCIIGPKITPFSETNVFWYAGEKNNVQETMLIASIDLSIATRKQAVPNPLTGEPDYRPEVYREFLL